jgi:thiamine-monophosphate kinase
MDEFVIIARFFAPLAGEGAFGLTDDAAVIAPRPGHDLVVTTDAIMEGTDFFGHDPADTIARKALRVNLSDLAAKGAEPFAYLLNLALPQATTPDWLQAFAAGLAQDQKQFGISLLGGDTAATDGPLTVAVTAFGYVPRGRMIRRSGAKAGDAVYVTGTIGDSGGGLAIFKREKHALSDEQRDQLIAHYRVPEPPVGFGATRLRDVASASVDISDGLIADLGHLARASGVAITVDGEAIPLSPALRAWWGENAIMRAATEGDDYQIAFTGASGLEGPFTRIGSVAAGEGVHLLIGGVEMAVPRPGYRHF